MVAPGSLAHAMHSALAAARPPAPAPPPPTGPAHVSLPAVLVAAALLAVDAAISLSLGLGVHWWLLVGLFRCVGGWRWAAVADGQGGVGSAGRQVAGRRPAPRHPSTPTPSGALVNSPCWDTCLSQSSATNCPRSSLRTPASCWPSARVRPRGGRRTATRCEKEGEGGGKGGGGTALGLARGGRPCRAPAPPAQRRHPPPPPCPTLEGMYAHVVLCLGVTAFGFLAYSLAFAVRPAPWWNAQYRRAGPGLGLGLCCGGDGWECGAWAMAGPPRARPPRVPRPGSRAPGPPPQRAHLSLFAASRRSASCWETPSPASPSAWARC